MGRGGEGRRGCERGGGGGPGDVRGMHRASVGVWGGGERSMGVCMECVGGCSVWQRERWGLGDLGMQG